MYTHPTDPARWFDELCHAQDSSHLEKQISQLQCIVAMLLEKNEALRQRLVENNTNV